MSLRSCLQLYILFLLSSIIFAREHSLFWRREGKQLLADPIDTVKINKAENCLHECLYNKRCKSFNVFEGKKVCELYSVGRCTADPHVQWLDRNGVAYFDLIGGKCPTGKYDIKIFVLKMKFCCTRPSPSCKRMHISGFFSV